jgi:integrase
MPVVTLTDALIRALVNQEVDQPDHWDTEARGLVLRVSKHGTAAYHVRATGPDGRKRFFKLGRWPGLSLKQARSEARLQIGRIQRGEDPLRERRAERQATEREAAMPTLAMLVEAWAKASARDTGARYRAEIIGTVRRGCGDRRPGKRGQRRADGAGPGGLLAKRVAEITEGDLAKVIHAARERGDGEARHLVRALRRLFRFAVAVEHIQYSPVETWMRRESGGRRSIPWMKDHPRERVLTDPEIVQIWAASAGLDPVARAFTRVLLLTACRSGEISGLGWREVERGPAADATDSIMALRLAPTRTKNRRGHRVPLGSLAAHELHTLIAAARKNDGGTPMTSLVFPGVVSRVAGVCRALRSAIGTDDWTWHDLRRTAATGMARLGCPREHVEAALNHITARGGLIGIYQRYDFQQEAEKALLAWQAHVASLVATAPESQAPIMRTRRPSATVVKFPSSRHDAAVA